MGMSGRRNLTKDKESLRSELEQVVEQTSGRTCDLFALKRRLGSQCIRHGDDPLLLLQGRVQTPETPYLGLLIHGHGQRQILHTENEKRKPSLVGSLLLHSQSHIQGMVRFSF